jgi:hypothetical protein
MRLPSPVLNLSVPPRQIPPDEPWFRPSPGELTPTMKGERRSLASRVAAGVTRLGLYSPAMQHRHLRRNTLERA